MIMLTATNGFRGKSPISVKCVTEITMHAHSNQWIQRKRVLYLLNAMGVMMLTEITMHAQSNHWKESHPIPYLLNAMESYDVMILTKITIFIAFTIPMESYANK